MPSAEPRPELRQLPSRQDAEIASLHGIRAIAVLMVFLAHSGLEGVVPGGLGVTIFFVLSGFLITTLMRREYASTGRVQLPAFYLRRLLRLMPPLFVVVMIAGLLSSLSLIDGQFSLRGLLSVLFYFGNYQVIAENFGGIPAGIGVVWSLAVEEHFYLLYPPLAMALLRSGNRSSAIIVLSSLCLLMLVWRFWLYAAGVSEAYLSMATDTRADAILVGCLMAFWRNPAFGAVMRCKPRRDTALAVLCLCLLLFSLVYRNEFFRLTLRYSLQSLAIAPLIYLAVARAGRAPYRWLNAPPLVYLGTISYTVYLSHQLILDGLRHNWPAMSWAMSLVIGLLLTLALAELMRRWIEAPCARLRRQLHGRVAATADTAAQPPARPSSIR